jgi:hypothetical protein
MLLLLAAMLTVGVAAEPVTVMLLEVAVAEVAHVALDVSTTLTASPFTNVPVVKVALLVPALLPFTFHW